MDHSPQGLIFNIVKGSFVDGYGIRTTIFLKGCPLKCIWCCNPEGQDFAPEVAVIPSQCTGCRKCLEACPEGAVILFENGLGIDRTTCTGCGKCVQVCLPGALTMFGTWYTADEMFELIRQDKPFYDVSGGGLTIGGGEATYWPEFVLSLIEKCKGEGIRTAIDTCGYVTSKGGLACLEAADLLLFDIKGLDPVAHEKNTGKSNEVILRNLKRMNEIGKPIIIRIPYIPGYNDDENMVCQAAEMLSGLSCIERVDIIPMHEFGKVKYEQIGKEYTLESSTVPESKKQQLLELFTSYGLKTQIGG